MKHNVEEYEWTSAYSRIYKKWGKAIGKKKDCRPGRGKIISNSILREFAKAIRASGLIGGGRDAFKGISATERFGLRAKALQDLEKYSRRSKEGEPQVPPEYSDLPEWICNQNLIIATKKIHRNSESASFLRDYWYEKSAAAKRATEGTDGFADYLSLVRTTFKEVMGQEDNPNKILSLLTEASGELAQFDEDLSAHIRPAVAYAEKALHEQLSYDQSGQATKFDVAELAHALRVVCRFGEAVDFRLISVGLETICRWQRPDGTWPAQRAFLWNAGGTAVHAHSMDVAWAVVSIMNTVIQKAEQLGIAPADIASHFELPNLALHRFFAWPNGSAIRFRLPKEFNKAWQNSRSARKLTAPPSHVVGWCSDKVTQPATIQLWATAAAIEFLIEYRDLLQDRVNNAIRDRFQSYHPHVLHKLASVAPTDLGYRRYKDRAISRVRKLLQDHVRLDRLENSPYFHQTLPQTKPNRASMILYGPPGTSKTHLAKAIAGELNWPLVSLSPSDFLVGGESSVETRAKEIFDALQHGSRIVYFFDEIDELILDREAQKTQQRNVFSFLTPSFLTKLQDLRDAAEEREFIFLIGTNYLERIDPAARRTGRIDENFLVLYPDMPSRAGIIVDEIIKLAKKDLEKERQASGPKSGKPVNDLQEIVERRFEGKDLLLYLSQATALLQFLKLKTVTEKIWNKYKPVKGKKSTTRNKISSAKKFGKTFGIGDGREYRWEVELDTYITRPGAESELKELLHLLRQPIKQKGKKSKNQKQTRREENVGKTYSVFLKTVRNGCDHKAKSARNSSLPTMNISKFKSILSC